MNAIGFIILSNLNTFVLFLIFIHVLELRNVTFCHRHRGIEREKDEVFWPLVRRRIQRLLLLCCSAESSLVEAEVAPKTLVNCQTAGFA